MPNFPTQNPTVVIGGGVSGLTLAWQLKRRGQKVLVLEAENRAGGCIRTETCDGFTIDFGPNTALETRSCIAELVASLGLQNEFQYASAAAQNRYILRSNRLNALPTSPLKFLLTRHFSWRAKLRLLCEPFFATHLANTDISLAQFVEDRLGREFLDYAIDPFVAGVFAGDPRTLSVKSAFPKLWALEQEYGSLIKGALLGARERRKRGEVSKNSAKMFSFRGGMERLTQTMARELSDSIRLGHRVEKIDKLSDIYTISGYQMDGQPFSFEVDRVVVACPAYRASKIISHLHPQAAQILDKIYYPPVAVQFQGFSMLPPGGRPLDGFGYLIPRMEMRRTLGTLWTSTIFPDRAPQGGAAFTTFIGGARQPQEALENAELRLTKSWGELGPDLGLTAKPTLVRSVLWEKAIPQYQVGHEDLMQVLADAELQLPGLHFLANYRGGISLSDCLGNATLLAERLWEARII